MSGTIERKLLRPSSARLLKKLCDSDNNVGSVVLERCENETTPRMDLGRKKKAAAIKEVNTRSPFYVRPQDLPQPRKKTAKARRRFVILLSSETYFINILN